LPGTNVFDIAARSFVIACLVFGPGCRANFPEAPTPAPLLSSIQLHYNNPHSSVGVGNSVSLTVYALNSSGIFENVSNRASWLSVNPEIASVTPGLAHGERGGITDVIVTYGGLTATARIIVAVPGQILSSLTLRPAPSLVAGETSQARALLGTTDVTSQAAWTSSDPRVLTVAAGAITNVGPGTAAVTATVNGATATYYASVPPIRSLPSAP